MIPTKTCLKFIKQIVRKSTFFCRFSLCRSLKSGDTKLEFWLWNGRKLSRVQFFVLSHQHLGILLLAIWALWLVIFQLLQIYFTMNYLRYIFHLKHHIEMLKENIQRWNLSNKGAELVLVLHLIRRKLSFCKSNAGRNHFWQQVRPKILPLLKHKLAGGIWNLGRNEKTLFGLKQTRC